MESAARSISSAAERQRSSANRAPRTCTPVGRPSEHARGHGHRGQPEEVRAEREPIVPEDVHGFVSARDVVADGPGRTGPHGSDQQRILGEELPPLDGQRKTLGQRQAEQLRRVRRPRLADEAEEGADSGGVAGVVRQVGHTVGEDQLQERLVHVPHTRRRDLCDLAAGRLQSRRRRAHRRGDGRRPGLAGWRRRDCHAQAAQSAAPRAPASARRPGRAGRCPRARGAPDAGRRRCAPGDRRHRSLARRCRRPPTHRSAVPAPGSASGPRHRNSMPGCDWSRPCPTRGRVPPCRSPRRRRHRRWTHRA